MVLEYGDIDLARLLAKHEKARREDGAEDLDENFIRLYWQQMLQVATHLPPLPPDQPLTAPNANLRPSFCILASLDSYLASAGNVSSAV